MITNKYTNEQYHALPSISKSGLDLIAKSPAHFKAGFQGIGADTARIGTGAHALVLENGKGLLTGIDRKRASNADKEAWDEWFAENGATESIATELKAAEWFPEFERQTGNVIVTPSEKGELEAMRDSVLTVAGDLFTGGVAEQSILFEHDGVDCRVRPDYMSVDKNVMVDLKSSADASERGFRSSCAKYRYHVQHAMYSAGLMSETQHWPDFYFVVFEKKAPYPAAVYKLNEDAINHGIYLMERDLATYKRCLEDDEWPGYESNYNLSIPIWEAPEVVENYADLVA